MAFALFAMVIGISASSSGEVVADFEAGMPAGVVVEHGKGVIDGEARVGKGALKAEFDGAIVDGRRPRVVIEAPGVEAAEVRGLGMWMKARTDGEPNVGLRVVAIDGAGRRLYQRRVRIRSGEAWERVELPLVEWRWGNVVGAWGEVRKLAIEVETSVLSVGFDDIAWIDGADAKAGRDWLVKLAFAGRDARMVEADGLLIATDAVEEIGEADLRRMLGNARKVRAMVKRLFGDAVRPIDHPTPAAFLIFRDAEEGGEFWKRVGKSWMAEIRVSVAGGFTVQDIATSSWDARQGADRPVYLHETVHAVLGRDVRLVIGNERHWWLHEGMANYVQLCVYPQALRAEVYPSAFARYAAGQQGLFVPVKELLSKRGTARNYAQLASVAAFLVEKRPGWLPVIARTLAEGGTAQEGLKRCGSSLEGLEKEWMEWGRVRFRVKRGVEAGHFEKPAEWNGVLP